MPQSPYRTTVYPPIQDKVEYNQFAKQNGTLKRENEALKEENEAQKMEIVALKGKLEKTEAKTEAVTLVEAGS
ncbi:hypothetical protein MMC22_000928 [Lobaria immixta]|nr:hypothetical protein [Lobaria immixta]